MNVHLIFIRVHVYVNTGEVAVAWTVRKLEGFEHGGANDLMWHAIAMLVLSERRSLSCDNLAGKADRGYRKYEGNETR